MTNATAAGGPAPRHLVATLGALGLFGRLLLFVIGELLIVPMPWVTTLYNAYVCDHLLLPDGRRLKFTGKPGDIWYILMGIPLIMYILQAVNVWTMHDLTPGQLPNFGVFFGFAIAAELATYYLGLLVLRWAIANTTTEDNNMRLSFDGSFWGLIGWTLLLGLSGITIIGWAWVLKFFIRWICRKVEGTVRFDFIGPGWGILWRLLVAWLLCIPLIPIPWVIRWIMNWLFSNVVVTSSGRA
jgi:hypothetical protein